MQTFRYCAITLIVICFKIGYSRNVIQNECPLNLAEVTTLQENVRWLENLSQLSQIDMADTAIILVKEIVFKTRDTTFMGYVSIEPSGWYHFLLSSDHIENHIVLNEVTVTYADINKRGSLKKRGSKSTFNMFVNISSRDTLNLIDLAYNQYFKNNNFILSDDGIPLILYDIELAYVLNQINVDISDRVIVSIYNTGSKNYIKPVMFPNKIRKSYVCKIDMGQDSTFNFYNYYLKQAPGIGLQLISKDSCIVPLKKIERSWINRSLDSLRINYDTSLVHNKNDRDSRVLLFEGNRYYISYYYPAEKADSWVEYVLYITNQFNWLSDKYCKTKK